METVVLEPLGDVLLGDASGRLERAEVDDELVSALAVLAAEEDVVGAIETGGHVVGVEDGVLGRMPESLGSHHLDVKVRDGEDGGGSKGSAGDGASGLGNADSGLSVSAEVSGGLGVDDVSGEVGGEVRSNADGTNSGSSSSVGNAESLVEVQVANISTDGSRAGKSNLSVHVGSVHVNLSSSIVDAVADLDDVLLEDSKGGRVGDHEASEVVAVLCNLGLEVLHVAVTLVVVVNDNDLHAGHGGRSRVGTVGRLWDEADVPVPLTLFGEVVLDAKETSELSGGAGVGLGGDSGEACDLTQVPVEVLDHLVVTLDLVVRGEGVDVRGLVPSNGDHLGSSVQLHGAGAKTDHGVVEGEVLVLEGLEVPEHLGLGVVLVEDGMSHDILLPVVASTDVGLGYVGGKVGGGDAKAGGEEGGEVLAGDALAHADSDGVVVDDADVASGGGSGGSDGGRSHALGGDVDGEGVEEVFRSGREPGGGDLAVRDAREGVDATSDVLDALGSVVHGVGSGHVGEEGLRRAKRRAEGG